jgi:oligopeptidase B
MKRDALFGPMLFFSSVIHAQNFESMKAPEAGRQVVTLEIHGHQRQDPYFWMNKRDSPEVLEYIGAENAFSAAYFRELDPAINRLMKEFDERIDPNDVNAPQKVNGLTCQWRNVEGKDYRELWLLRSGKADALFFDENARAAKHDFYELGDWSNSPDNHTLAFSEDFIGRRKYTIRFRTNEGGKFLKDEIANTDGSVVWANDNKTVFYVRKDETTLREFRVYRHILGTSASADELIYEEKDERFSVFTSKSLDDRYIFIYSQSSTTSEIRLIDAVNPKSQPQVFLARIQGHLYQADHHANGFYLLSNWKSPNRTLLHTPGIPAKIEDCKTLIAHDADTYLEAFLAHDKFLVVQQRTKGKTEFVYGDPGAENLKPISFEEAVYEAGLQWNDDYYSTELRYAYNSLTTPASVCSFDMLSGERDLVFRKTLRDKNFTPDNYRSERVWVTANDGTQIPVSLVYKKGVDLKKAPLLLYGYGSYGVTIPANFSALRLSLLDRGFVFAIAHIRGGKFMGEAWYENGKLQQKRNTFTDFINCAEWLSMRGYCDPNSIYAQGGSAGGLLMGAVTNMAPHLFKGIIAQVPFVDVVTTMLDETIPLTVGEYEEWGNPNEEASYWYMLSYSPYDQVRPAHYPAMLITTGYHDSQVQYWEPLKWVAKLRDNQLGNAPILFDCTMSAGHGGGSGRTTERLEVAKEFAFLLNEQGIAE